METTVHGDFHPGQVLVEDGGLMGVIDIDRARRGQRVDDLAVMLAHLHVTAMAIPGGGRPASYGRSLLTHFDELVDPALVRRRVSAALIGLAPGGFTVQDPNWPTLACDTMTAATQWADTADRLT